MYELERLVEEARAILSAVRWDDPPNDVADTSMLEQLETLMEGIRPLALNFPHFCDCGPLRVTNRQSILPRERLSKVDRDIAIVEASIQQARRDQIIAVHLVAKTQVWLCSSLHRDILKAKGEETKFAQLAGDPSIQERVRSGNERKMRKANEDRLRAETGVGERWKEALSDLRLLRDLLAEHEPDIYLATKWIRRSIEDKTANLAEVERDLELVDAHLQTWSLDPRRINLIREFIITRKLLDAIPTEVERIWRDDRKSFRDFVVDYVLSPLWAHLGLIATETGQIAPPMDEAVASVVGVMRQLETARSWLDMVEAGLNVARSLVTSATTTNETRGRTEEISVVVPLIPTPVADLDEKRDQKKETSVTRAFVPLNSWNEIISALNSAHKARHKDEQNRWKNDSLTRRKIRKLTSDHDGPIEFPTGKGKQPFVNEVALLAWWDGLGERYDSFSAEQKADTESIRETVSNSYAHGQSARVVPDIGGAEKKSRSKTAKKAKEAKR